MPTQIVGDSEAVQRLMGVWSTSPWDTVHTGDSSPLAQVATPVPSSVPTMTRVAIKLGPTQKATQQAVPA